MNQEGRKKEGRDEGREGHPQHTSLHDVSFQTNIKTIKTIKTVNKHIKVFTYGVPPDTLRPPCPQGHGDALRKRVYRPPDQNPLPLLRLLLPRPRRNPHRVCPSPSSSLMKCFWGEGLQSSRQALHRFTGEGGEGEEEEKRGSGEGRREAEGRVSITYTDHHTAQYIQHHTYSKPPQHPIPPHNLPTKQFFSFLLSLLLT